MFQNLLRLFCFVIVPLYFLCVCVFFTTNEIDNVATKFNREPSTPRAEHLRVDHPAFIRNIMAEAGQAPFFDKPRLVVNKVLARPQQESAGGIFRRCIGRYSCISLASLSIFLESSSLGINSLEYILLAELLSSGIDYFVGSFCWGI